MLFVGTSIIHPSTEGVFLLCNILDLLIYSKEVTDGSVVVQVPEGSTVESLFDFTSTENISLSGATSGIIHVGNLENGNSVVWRSDSVFLYLQGKARDVSVVYYSNRLDDDPIPYSEFKE